MSSESAIEHRPARTLRFRTVIDMAASLMMLVAAALIIKTNVLDRRAPAALPIVGKLVRFDGPTMIGSSTATTGVIVFSDFQCPYCKRFADEIIPVLRAKYVDTGRIRLIFRHLPLTGIHPVAMPSAIAASCAAHVGSFWPMHDLLFKAARLDDDVIRSAGKALSLGATFDQCVANEGRLFVDDDLRMHARFNLPRLQRS